MYLMPDFIDIGLQDGEEFKSSDHEQVAVSLAIGRPGIDTADQLQHIISVVNAVPIEKIRLVSYNDLVADYGLVLGSSCRVTK